MFLDRATYSRCAIQWRDFIRRIVSMHVDRWYRPNRLEQTATRKQQPEFLPFEPLSTANYVLQLSQPLHLFPPLGH